MSDREVAAALSRMFSEHQGCMWVEVDGCVYCGDHFGVRLYQGELPEDRKYRGGRSAAPAICGVVSQSGPNREPLACGFPKGHEGEHAWATLPTFTASEDDREAIHPADQRYYEAPPSGASVKHDEEAT
jgi:hypothetical protein